MSEPETTFWVMCVGAALIAYDTYGATGAGLTLVIASIVVFLSDVVYDVATDENPS